MLRCPECRSRRASLVSLVAHVKATGHKACNCGGYGYKHRPNSPYCYQNAMADVRHAARRGETLEVQMEIAADSAWDRPGVKVKAHDVCPF